MNARMATTFSANDVTGLLHEWQQGDRAAFDKLMPLVYGELRRIARRYMRKERAEHTLQTTALVNEAYVRLVGGRHQAWQDRAHFYAVVAQVMRHALVDHARRRLYAKRGAGAQTISFDERRVMADERAAELVRLDEALGDLARMDERKSRVVELRYFGGLSIEETAEVLGLSQMTVRRDWRAAKAWLYRELGGSGDAGEERT